MDANYWNERYLNKETGWDIGYASPVFKAYFQSKLKYKSILIPGAGNAYEAIMLEELGFRNITVLDWSEEVVNQFNKNHPNFKGRVLSEDFFNHQGKYDFILEQTFFCALQPVLREKYVTKMSELLSDKGRLVGVLFNKEFDVSPPFGGNELEYKKWLQTKFEILRMELNTMAISPRKGVELFFECEKK